MKHVSSSLFSFATLRRNKIYLLSFILLGCALFFWIWQAGKEADTGPGTTDGKNSGQTRGDHVQILVPGFSVRQLPLDITNINVVRYGKDGNLYALAYDGHIYVLKDTDGDGLEDKAEYWWDKQPLLSPVGMVVADEGIYVTSLNKVSLLKDQDNDGKADIEEVITSGWIKPDMYTGTTSSGVDAFGIAKDSAGNIFFALGTANFTNAYLIDSTGKSRYDLKSERGTVLKISQGSHEREIFCTGMRFPVAMAFNDQGDLFATDQEGATWLPNGNPFDELLHIQKGRHYGFPPRHSKYLPDVIDEPSVYDYKPQHQSTCGLNFNLPVNNGPVFGPEWWRGDAIVTGYSRGKIYRTKLVKTARGYIGSNSIFARLSSLTVDACISPKGDLVISTHSGNPDWGYGPLAKGKLYKVFYSAPEQPVPVAVWVSSPQQMKIAFDKPIPADYLRKGIDSAGIQYGNYVGAGDEFEVVRPGYWAVERQLSFPRETMRIKSAQLSDDRRTLILNMFADLSLHSYAISLPAFPIGKEQIGNIRQEPVMDVGCTLNGVNVKWTAEDNHKTWRGWLPHLDLQVSSELMRGSSDHVYFESLLSKPGTLELTTQLNLWNMLRPETQPESVLDDKLPSESIRLVFQSSVPLSIRSDSGKVSVPQRKQGFYETIVSFDSIGRHPYPCSVSMSTGEPATSLSVYYYSTEDRVARDLQVHRFFLPWLKNIFEEEMLMSKKNPELAGGNWMRGKKLFFGDATCSTCHTIDGKGKSIGPDLSNLVFRDYKSVLRDIEDPSASINPDFLAHTVILKDKRSLTGMVSYTKDSIIVKDIVGNEHSYPRSRVESTTPLPRSLMPIGLDKMIGKDRMKDLLTNFKPGKIERMGLPMVRSRAEVEAVLNAGGRDTIERGSGGPTEGELRNLKILWVSGPKDHGVDEHDYPLQQERWSELLSMAEHVTVSTADQWPTDKEFKEADVIVFYRNFPGFREENGKQLDEFLKRGGGLVFLHFALDASLEPTALANRIGYAWKTGVSKYRHGEIKLEFSGNHTISKGLTRLTMEDESYWELIKGNKAVNIIATSMEDGKEIPMIWTTTAGKGRIFSCVPGHYSWTFDDPLFRILLLRGIVWSANRPSGMLEDLVTVGARTSK